VASVNHKYLDRCSNLKSRLVVGIPAAMLAQGAQQAPTILDLPVEIRRQILIQLFEDCELRVKWRQRTAANAATGDDCGIISGGTSATMIGFPQSVPLVCKALWNDVESLKPFKIQKLNAELCQDKGSDDITNARSTQESLADLSHMVSLKDVRIADVHGSNLQSEDVFALKAMFVGLESVEYRLKSLDLNVNAAPNWVWPVLLDEDNEVVSSSSDQDWASDLLVRNPSAQDQTTRSSGEQALKLPHPSLQKDLRYFGRQEVGLWKNSEAIIHLVSWQQPASINAHLPVE
jgi:hypothetical protein